MVLFLPLFLLSLIIFMPGHATAADEYADMQVNFNAGDSTDEAGQAIENPANNGDALSLGHRNVAENKPGELVVNFVESGNEDNAAFNKDGIDLEVIEVETDEGFSVEVFSDGSWHSLGTGTRDKDTVKFDFSSGGLADEAKVTKVKIIDDGVVDGAPDPDGGADINGIKAIYPWNLIIDKVSSSYLPEDGNKVTISAELDPAVNGRWKLSTDAQNDLTTEKGNTMNFGSQLADDKDFLWETQSGWTVIDEKNIEKDMASQSGSADLSSKDYGSFTTLEGKIIEIEGNSISPQIPGHVENGTADFIRVPLDENGNKIGDAWTHDSGNRGDDTDNDPSGDGADGDHLTRYEEYRGFFLVGIPTRTNPNKKDVFVRDVDSLGIGPLNTSNVGAPIHYILGSEWVSSTRVINNKTDAASISQRLGDQTAIKVEASSFGLGDMSWGLTAVKQAGQRFVPNNEDFCRVAEQRHTDEATDLRGGVDANDTKIRVWRDPTDGTDLKSKPEIPFKSAPGQFKVGNEVMEYNDIIVQFGPDPGTRNDDTFVFVVEGGRGAEGTTATSHGNHDDVLSFWDPDDLVKNTFGHEAAHLFDLPDAGNNQTPEPNSCNCIMDGLNRGAIKGQHYFDTYGSLVDQYFRVKP
jgi:hypothetical protein